MAATGHRTHAVASQSGIKAQRASGEEHRPRSSKPGHVLGLKGLSRAADAALLDPCDEHRDEGGGEAQSTSHSRCGKSGVGVHIRKRKFPLRPRTPSPSFLCLSQESSQPKSLG
ncbi:hypothetical protein EME01_53160 [Sinorhizobium meliloti]|nr:hypothetical protein EME01_53160 [Sinorhizobium meliloti]